MTDSSSEKPLELFKITKVANSETAPERPKARVFPINTRLRAAPVLSISDAKKRHDFIRAEFLALRYERERKKAA